ncbi:MAG: PKD domain-containing protein [Thermoplasmata archaeon]|nr:MAG: PKD domain-containing protein [Thermoplasmata archaeon]
MEPAGIGPGPLDGMRTARRYRTTSMLAALMLLALVLTACAPVLADPVAEAGPDIRDFTGRPVVFEGFGTPDTSQRIILYEWDFDGDGVYDWNSTKTGMCTNRFWEVGVYNASLRVTQFDVNQSRLLTDTDTVTVTIESGKPVGQASSSTTAEIDRPHRFTAEYYDLDGGILEYEWRIDGVMVSTEETFRHTFEELGKFNVSLHVTDDEDEFVSTDFIVEVVEEVDESQDFLQQYMIFVIAIAMAVVGVIAYIAILRGHKRKHLDTYADLAEDTSPIVPEASLTEDRAEPVARAKPRIVRPERSVPSDTGKSKEDAVPGAPPRLPCSECGTPLSAEGTCPFCTANEEIDEVEKSIRELQEDGFILAKADEELETAKTELHVKNFEKVDESLANARELLAVAMRDHERCLTLMALVDELIMEAEERDLDVTKANNLQKLSKSFMKSGKYPKAIYYAERSRDYLLETLEPFDLDLYFCEHCKSEVAEEDDVCPSCDQDIESGLIRRAKRELAELKRRFEGISRDHERHTPIAAELEKADEHVDSRSASAAKESIAKARSMLDDVGTEEDAEAAEGDEGTSTDEGPPEGEDPETGS